MVITPCLITVSYMKDSILKTYSQILQRQKAFFKFCAFSDD